MTSELPTDVKQNVRIKRVRAGVPTTLVSAALVVSGVLYATSGSGAATTPVSQSLGRFLSGSVGGTNLDTVVGVMGEQAINTGVEKTVLNSNDLNAEVLNGAINLPLQKALHLPGLGALQLGAVSQYAKAVNDGSALGASGAINDQGGVSLGGTTSTPANASLNLAGLGGASAATIAKTLGNLNLSIGAISAQATQAAGQGGAQTGKYQVAGLTLDLTAPGLAAAVGQLTSTVQTAVNSIASTLGAIPGLSGLIFCPNPVPNPAPLTLTCVSGLSDINTLTTQTLGSITVANGAVSASLATGAIHVDLAKLLKNLGLDLNNLPANTSLMPYLSQALSTQLPAALTTAVNSLITQLEAKSSQIGLIVLGQSISAANPLFTTLQNTLMSSIITPLTNALSSGSAQLGSAVFTPLAQQLAALLDIIVNGQKSSGGKFTETALELVVGEAAAGQTLPISGLPTSFAQAPASVNARALGAAAAPVAHAAPAAHAAPVVHAAPINAANAPVDLKLAVASVGPGAQSGTTQGSFVSTPAGGTPTATSSIHVQSGGGLAPAPIVASPVGHNGDRIPVGIAIAALGLLGLAVPRRRAIARVIAHAKR